MLKAATFFTIVSVSCLGQTKVNLRTQSGDIDFRNADKTSPFKVGTTLPTVCSPGELFFLTNTTSGGNIYGCSAIDLWQVQGTLEVGPPGTLLSTNGTVRQWIALGGDLSGTPLATQVTGLQNRSVSAIAPQNGQSLIWDGAVWKPQSIGGQLGTITLQNQGTQIGTRGVVNVQAGFGLLNITADTGSKLNLQQSINTAVVLSRSTHQAGSTLLCSTSGTGSAYTCGLSPALASYTSGMVLNLKPHVASIGGIVTLNIDGLGAVPITRADGTTLLSSGDLVANVLYAIWHDGTSFRMIEAPAASLPSGDSRPACDVSYRGRLWHFFSAAGAKDEVAVCVKDAANAYSWWILY